jgi:plastocyanin
MKHQGIILAIILSSFCSSVALAAGATVSQKDKNFSVEEVKVTAGQPITFVNEDEVAHNIYGTGANEFQVKKQNPGETTSVTLDKKGEVNVTCAIHPKMKLKIIVE